jgi:hypothetical protein
MKDPRFAKASAWEYHNQGSPEQVERADACGRDIAVGPVDPTALIESAERESRSGNVLRAFENGFLAAVLETTERQAEWATAIERSLTSACDLILHVQPRDHDARELDGAVTEWMEETDPFSVWGRLPELHGLRYDAVWYWASRLILVDAARGLRALDTLPCPVLMKDALAIYCRQDRELIEAMIRAAPPAFDEGGSWRPGHSVAALLVTDLITEHAQSLYDTLRTAMRVTRPEQATADATQELEDVAQRELPAWMLHAFSLLLTRQDGLPIALGYLGQLSRGELIGSSRPHDPSERWSAGAAALDALATTLRRIPVGVKGVRDAWRVAEQRAHAKDMLEESRSRVTRRTSTVALSDKDGEGARPLRGEGLPLLYGAAILLGEGPTNEVEIRAFWEWFEELLEGRDPGLSLINQGTSLTVVPQRFGFLLSRLASPDTVFSATYAKLEPHRRRALFARRYDEMYQDLESIVLLRVGLNAAANWRGQTTDDSTTEASRALFLQLFNFARRLWLTAVLDTGDTKRQLVVTCFAFMPFIFGDRLGEALKETIPPIANDSRLLADACANLRLNRIEASDLRRLVASAGADLGAALRDARQWSDITGHAKDFPAHLAQLAEEIRSGADAARGAHD